MERMIKLLKMCEEIDKKNGPVEPLDYQDEFFCSIE